MLSHELHFFLRIFLPIARVIQGTEETERLCKLVLVLNCLLQIEYVNSDCAESGDESLPLAFLSLGCLSASQILFDSNCAALLLMRQRHFVGSCAACSQDSSVGILESLSEALRMSL